MIWKAIRAILFRVDAESAHRVTVRMLRFAVPLLRVLARLRRSGQPVEVFGLRFRNAVGLAAGFDKDAEILEALPALGFGFAEIGTVTPRPQPGNDRPRLFRDPARGAIFNRMGFNSLGATIVSEQLRRVRDRLPGDFRVGLNIGKNKETPLEEAANDYAAAVAPFQGLVDYVVINVSSPNTPGLRSLQTVEGLKPIVQAVDAVLRRWSSRPPLLLKFAPEVDQATLAELIRAAEVWGIDGWVLTNTLAGEWRPGVSGGWSGKPLRELSRERLCEVRALTRKPVISVGGIVDAEEAKLRQAKGADLIQVYSGWILNGPQFPARIARALD